MKKHGFYVSMLTIGVMLIGGYSAVAADTKTSASPLFESSDAKSIIAKDALASAAKHSMPNGCVSNDPKSIQLGKILFNDYNNKNHKFKEFPDKKEFGNCVACHNIEGASGYGNIGPDLTGYRKHFIESGVRTQEWAYQKIADPRVDDPATKMTINKTNGLLNEQEICNIMSYMLADK